MNKVPKIFDDLQIVSKGRIQLERVFDEYSCKLIAGSAKAWIKSKPSSSGDEVLCR